MHMYVQINGKTHEMVESEWKRIAIDNQKDFIWRAGEG